MQFFTFDLGEFLSYIIPGFLLLVAGTFWFPDEIKLYITAYDALGLPGWLADPAPLLLAICLSVACGHLTTVWRRGLLDRVIDFGWGKARDVVLRGQTLAKPGKKSNPYALPSALVDTISVGMKGTYALDLNDKDQQRAAIKVMESALAQQAATGFKTIDHHTRARSLCGNLVFPMLVLAIDLAVLNSRNILPATLAGLATYFLAVKYRDLDLRQARDTVLAYAALTVGGVAK
jgi:hypothetical protein